MFRCTTILLLALLSAVVLTAGCQSESAQRGAAAQPPATQSAAADTDAAERTARDTSTPTPRATAQREAHARSDDNIDERRAEARSTPEQSSESGTPRVVTPFPGIRVHVNGERVEVEGKTCLDAGWLEFVACSPNTKEHESLVVLPQRPSNIHAAMLLAGFEAGRPGAWTYENEQFELIPPQGSKVQLRARYANARGTVVTENICNWIRDHLGNEEFPCAPWVFGGSKFEQNPPHMGEGEHYVADMTGSVIGLATFGDEMIGYSEVIAHDSSVHAPEWEVDSDAVPPVGTDVTLIIEPYEP